MLLVSFASKMSPLPFPAVSCSSGEESSELLVREKDRLTKGDNSASTFNERKAACARRWLGSGRDMILKFED